MYSTGRSIRVYKRNYQRANALSTTGAKIYALYGGGKLIMYIISILEELGLEQEYVTSLQRQPRLLIDGELRPTVKMHKITQKIDNLSSWTG